MALAPRVAKARDALRDLTWADLVPAEGGFDLDALRAQGVVEHGQLSTPFDQVLGGKMTSAFDGMRVRIPGYLVPLEFEGARVRAALLVPYVGACIHVPPPPPNQLVFISTNAPYAYRGLFEAVHVTGLFSSSAMETELAEVGYSMTAADIAPYRN